MLINLNDSSAIFQVLNTLKARKLVILPTETVYGIACLADNSSAIKKIFELKKRELSKPISIMVKNLKQLSPFVEKIPLIVPKLINHFYPKSLTLILKSKNNLPPILTAQTNKIGFRIPDNPFLLKTLANLKIPLAITSANLSGEKSAITIAELNNNLKNKVSLIVDGGKSKIGIASTVVDLTTKQILRIGSIKKAEIKNFLKKY